MTRAADRLKLRRPGEGIALRFIGLLVALLIVAALLPDVDAIPGPFGLRAAGITEAVLVAAGDIAACDSVGDEATARLLDNIPGLVITLGDNAYVSGSPDEFAACYEPSWGRHKWRTLPSTGNHDYYTPNASGYFSYFGPAAGDPAKAYHSYDFAGWHVIVLNSNCAQVGGCDWHSEQAQWLLEDLAANSTVCTLAYWHHTPFSSGPHGGDPAVFPFMYSLYWYGADVVIAAHDHIYERFARQDPWGSPDAERGIRVFVAGTGGGSLYPITARRPNSEAAQGRTFGVLKLSLFPTRYQWEFLAVDGSTFGDSGTDTCH